MALKLHTGMSAIMKRLKTGRIRSIIVTSFTSNISCRRSSFLLYKPPSSMNVKFGYFFQAQKMALLSDSAAQIVVKEINFDDLQEQLKNNSITLIDVREPNELIKDGAIPSSVNIPLGDIKGAFALSQEKFQQKYGISLPSKDDSKLVFSCKSGRRAMMAIEGLHKMGYINTQCYRGSFLDWKAKGGQIVNL